MPAPVVRDKPAILDELVSSSDLPHVVSMHLFEAIPWIFDDDHLAYVRWKAKLAAALDVDPYAVLLVGSSAVGISLNPNRNFRTFHERSDVDVAVVSARHFEAAWHHLRSMPKSVLARLSSKARQEITECAPSYVYWGAIATDKILACLPFGARWAEALASMSAEPPTTGRAIKVRLYRDFDCLRSYQLRGVRAARERLLAGERPKVDNA